MYLNFVNYINDIRYINSRYLFSEGYINTFDSTRVLKLLAGLAGLNLRINKHNFHPWPIESNILNARGNVYACVAYASSKRWRAAGLHKNISETYLEATNSPSRFQCINSTKMVVRIIKYDLVFHGDYTHVVILKFWFLKLIYKK